MPGNSSQLRIVVLGFLVRGPVGGMAWCSLHFLLGLRRLGHEVLFIEDSTDSPWCCYDPERSVTDANPSFGIRYATEVFRRTGFDDAWGYWDAHTSRWLGPCAAIIEQRCREADLAINFSGANPLRDWTACIPRRAFIDTDPVYTQIKHLTESAAHAHAQQHNVFFTYAENIGQPGCEIPADGFSWQPCRQPISLEDWPVKPVPAGARFTTIMQWNSYQVREYAGKRYGMKSESFADYVRLPERTNVPLELALGGSDAPRDMLRAAGWQLVNPLEVATWPWDYQAYIQSSAGEFGVAKQGYVASHSGAFSDRTAAYLASGRPVIVQNTGFEHVLPTGEGLLPYSTPDEAVAALEAASREPERHQRAARRVAAECFDAARVLTRFVEQAMNV